MVLTPWQQWVTLFCGDLLRGFGQRGFGSLARCDIALLHFGGTLTFDCMLLRLLILGDV